MESTENSLRLLTQRRRCIKCGQPVARNALDRHGGMYEKKRSHGFSLDQLSLMYDRWDVRGDLVDDGEMDACIWAILIAIYPKFTVNEAWVSVHALPNDRITPWIA